MTTTAMPLNDAPIAAPAAAPARNGNSTPAAAPAVPLPEICARLHKNISDFLATPPKDELVACVQQQTRISLSVIQQALTTYTFNDLAISFNGGKDCLVLLVLFLSALPSAQATQKVPSVYVMSSSPFVEVDAFVETCVAEYALDLRRYAQPMKAAFTTYLRENPKVRAVFVGTRRSDPHGALLSHFDATDHGWPSFMRVQPVIDWHYREVWSFLRELDIPYCCLYDMGYTSLGGTTDTHPNPVLFDTTAATAGEKQRFRPAYELVEDEQERLGRDG